MTSEMQVPRRLEGLLGMTNMQRSLARRTLRLRSGQDLKARPFVVATDTAQVFSDNRQPTTSSYRNSSMHCSSTSREGRVTSSGKVASGASVMLSISRKLGAVLLM